MPYFLIAKLGNAGTQVVNLRCPICRHNGAFETLSNAQDASWTQGDLGGDLHAGVRRCPNADCRALVFVVMQGKVLLESFPPEVIDFDSTDLPAPILTTLEEAIKCHASGCYRASALMVRRLLEELCADKNAKGDDLKKRLAALGQTIVVPQGLLTAADQLRILGNDAAHIEARVYDQIGKDEAELAIDLAKELLKAVYQYTSLLARLTKNQKPAGGQESGEEPAGGSTN